MNDPFVPSVLNKTSDEQPRNTLGMLDCESVPSTLASLTSVSGLSAQRIIEIAASEISADLEQPFQELETRFRAAARNKIELTSAAFFHVSRRPQDATYADGLLPSHLAVEMIWRELERLAVPLIGKPTWDEFKRTFGNDESHHSRLFGLKQKPRLAGPYGFLVRAHIFDEYGEPYHYLTNPEMPADICRRFDERFGKNLNAVRIESTRPVIVKFRALLHADRPYGNWALQQALQYLRGCLKSLFSADR